MPGFLLHVNAGMQCFHQAPATTMPTQIRVLVSGQSVATLSNILQVTGCLFQIPPPTGPKPQPCVTIKWANVSSKVLINGQPVLLQTPPGPGLGSGICLSAEQIPQGTPAVSAIQTRVLAT